MFDEDIRWVLTGSDICWHDGYIQRAMAIPIAWGTKLVGLMSANLTISRLRSVEVCGMFKLKFCIQTKLLKNSPNSALTKI